MKNDGKFILDGKRVKFSDYGGSSMTSRFISDVYGEDGFAKFKRTSLTSEPPLDPPEPIDYKALSRKRDQMQEYTYEQYNDEIEREQELINNWRMHDALEDSLIEMEGK